MAEDVLLEMDGAVARVTLNRPDKLNALSPALLKLLAAKLDEVAASPARALLLTGAGRGFSSGADLSAGGIEVAQGKGLGDLLIENYWPVVEKLTSLPIPCIAAVNGPAAGAGVSVALACDLVIAARSAMFVQAFVNIGLVPDAGATWFLPRLVGRARAAGLMLTGEPLTAEKAAEWGMIWKVVDDAALAEETATLAHRLAAQPTKAMGAIKRALNAAEGQGLKSQVWTEADEQTPLGRTADFLEGVTAFVQKRKPVFRGA